jgi:hypothetical protein
MDRPETTIFILRSFTNIRIVSAVLKGAVLSHGTSFATDLFWQRGKENRKADTMGN